MNKPYLVVVTGRPGAGKTTFSKELGKELCMPVLSRDELKEGYVQTHGKCHSDLPDETNKIVTELFFETIHQLISGHVSLVVEAAFQHKVWASQLNHLKDKTRMILFICKTEDSQISLQRYLNRGLENPMREYFHGDKGVDLARMGIPLEETPYDEPHLDIPTYYIDTTTIRKPTIEEVKTIILNEKFNTVMK